MRDEEVLNALEVELAMWDWKDELPLDAIQECVLEGFKHMKLADTGADHHAIVFTKEFITNDEADYLYEHETEKMYPNEEEEEEKKEE